MSRRGSKHRRCCAAKKDKLEAGPVENHHSRHYQLPVQVAEVIATVEPYLPAGQFRQSEAWTAFVPVP
jgi:hypothetical protein